MVVPAGALAAEEVAGSGSSSGDSSSCSSGSSGSIGKNIQKQTKTYKNVQKCTKLYKNVQNKSKTTLIFITVYIFEMSAVF